MYKVLRSLVDSNGVRRLLVCVAQACVFALAGATTFLLRFDSTPPSTVRHYIVPALVVWIVVKTITFQLAGLNRPGMRYVSIDDIYRLCGANIAASAVSGALIVCSGAAALPRSVFLIDCILSFMGTAGIRIIARTMREAVADKVIVGSERRTLIYGAGDAGIMLLKEIRRNGRLPYKVCGFVDDRLSKQGLRINGVNVVGGGDKIQDLARRRKIEMILIAIPSATRSQIIRIISLCHAAGVECKTIPGLCELIEGDGVIAQIRDVAVEELLGRTPVHLEEERIRATLKGNMVLVTGAAGSIGSELCRQIARFRPRGIVGFDIAESALFEIELEMRERFPEVPFYAEIGSIQNRGRLDEVLRHHRPHIIYHAAAYKHVPLMEKHVFEAIENNVFGTLNSAVAAADNGVDKFVLISSDKAVRPTSVMGATKRIGEILLRALQNGNTEYVAVRFGNVLGSNGSVLPLFKKQIAGGGPIKVTHPEMRRFFMTIPEASQLVLEASAVGKGGQICVLDMGQPVKIVDLARNLIVLSGLKPGKDIKIEFTGTRPGEKLYEELSSVFEEAVQTDHEKVRILVEKRTPEVDVDLWLSSLRRMCDDHDLGGAIIALKEMIGDYSPGADLLRRMLGDPDQRIAAISSRLPSDQFVAERKRPIATPILLKPTTDSVR